jgi:hypothetical protein
VDFTSNPKEVAATSGRKRSGRMKRIAIASLASTCLSLVFSSGVAEAHQWAQWHWHRGGSRVNIYVWNGFPSKPYHEAARLDIHARPHPVWLMQSDTHTDVSLLEVNNQQETWGGLAEMINYAYPHVTHAHATLNTRYSWTNIEAQGVQCQEIAHTLGLDHAATGDCMAKGYYAGSTNFFGSAAWNAGGTSHPSQDLTNMYSTLK